LKMKDNNKQSGSCNSGGCGGNAAAAMKNMVIDNTLGKIKHKILVMSGKGGVGKSSVSTNLAVRLARKGYQVGLLDVDLHGPSIAGMMGISGLLDVTPDKLAIPKAYGDNLKIISMQSLMHDKDQAVIWRGPAKANAIRQFIGDVQWGDLDFLVIDSPPGTGDEPLSVAKTVASAKALIITTPQEVALADVRKSINFCRRIDLEMIGLLENMGPFDCPCCGKSIAIFDQGGGEKTAKEMGINFLGTLPFDPNVVKNCDKGTPIGDNPESSGFVTSLDQSIDRILKHLGSE
jgi:ATP-binding protein involved in chromosome partitioning